ncbi:MAG: transcription elongation factor GreA [Balneolales bacterium]
MKVNYMSPEGHTKLKEEFKDLITRGRKEIAEQIEEARSHGDLSENAEYDAAKEAQGKLEKRISELEDTLSRSRVVDEKEVDTSKVYVLSTVTLLNENTEKEMKYTLVSKEEADFSQGKISMESPIGSALMGKEVNETVLVKVPAGELKLKILKIERL